MRKASLVLIGLLASSLLVGAALAQSSANFKLPWHVFAGGGASTLSATYRLQSSVGPGLIGVAQSSNYGVGSGFWHGVQALGPVTSPEPSPTATPSSTSAPTRSPTPSPTATTAAGATATASPTATTSSGGTPTQTPSPSATSVSAATPTPSRTATSAPGTTPTASATTPAGGNQNWIYLPLILRNQRVLPSPTATSAPTLAPGATRTPTPTAIAERGIHGQVTNRGTPVDVEVELRFNAGGGWSTVATTTTGADGRYTFTGAASLGLGEQYQVRYGINAANEDYLYAAYGSALTSYTAGQSVSGGNLEIANVPLVGPGAAATIALPVTFTWQRRGIAGDTYEFILLDVASATWWTTGDLGDVNQFVLTTLPEGAEFNHEYRWYVRVHSPSGSYGDSFRYPTITFLE